MPTGALLYVVGIAIYAVLVRGSQLKTHRLRHSSSKVTGESHDAALANATDLLAAVKSAAASPGKVAESLTSAEAAALQKELGALTLALVSRSSGSGAENTLSFGPGDSAVAEFFGFEIDELSVRKLRFAFVVAFCVAVICAIIFELVHYRWAEADLNLELQYGQERKENQLLRLFAGVRPLISPYFCNPESNCSWYYLTAIAILGLIDLCLGLIYMVWVKEFWDTMEHKRGDEFMPLMIDFCFLVGTWIIVGTYSGYVAMMMMIHWRKYLTVWFLQKWLRAKAFYHIQLLETGGVLDNPDQRIQEDVPAFVRTSLQLGGGLAEAFGKLVTMLPLLLILSPDYAFGVVYCPGWLLYAAVLYSGLGTIAAHYIGNRLILINFALQKYEANFRYYIVQVRDHAESIALYNSEKVELGKMNELFDGIVRVWWMFMRYTKRLTFFTTFYINTSHTFPYLVLAPNYFKGQISLGTMFLLFRTLAEVKSAFDFIINSYSTLTDYRATVDRLSNFWHAVEDAPKAAAHVERLSAVPEGMEGNSVVARSMCIQLPGKEERKLWDNASLLVKPGQFVLLSAPEGSGKSCFLRALAGIWPHATGSVFTEDTCLFLPQRPFVPQGTLKQAIAYPESASVYTDEQVRRALEVVKLDQVCKQDLMEEANWEISLSGGEQQRLAIAHAVLQQPRVLFLDEATSALSEEGTREIFELLRKPGTLPVGATVVTVSHEIQALEPLHDVHFCYDVQSGTWVDANMK
jgi:putative ATP-binding cassette transporter